MAVKGFKKDFCNVDAFTPSSRTVEAIKEMNKVVEMGSLLEKIVMLVPVFQIFITPKVSMPKVGKGVTKYDWEQFAQAVSGINNIKRARLEEIAYLTGDLSTGEDKKFWSCVYNAL
ncbi:conserved hypothetical protein [Vibrio nigripulchritudo MADA3029]|uniref:Uncharacterized protein n=1 Tax=Vibrio nigripulchritudo SOn1 TaxID=1238450 RepID=A0AAV2VIW2_9VIBR|nr:hypothetical protein [Vibrio nigripulchritudo]CCN32783.1 conserved hypothetical protein [Vibrio nigripulchritudo AM115]CCN43591.1 conserved hypothetical protein [Vibrio nigripulchritudo FTn2]CCN47737.1 conserved hypothetical protein [Vibrio nigripulchritudo MADA3020]CCN55257.1 conserved hypothetical protein [Vibrio nigripulchritudo MADA3021]CCN58627.1 conserved hypothetical protein [Vibrio nigripulchritudo MADA3029]